MKYLVAAVLALSLILGIAFWKFSSVFEPSTTNKPIELTYWGLSIDPQTIKSVILAYQAQHPNIKINFSKENILNYRARLQTQIEAGQGPDILQIHSSWIPEVASDLTPAPSSLISVNDFNQTFYPLAKSSLIWKDKIYAEPTYVNGLALYINEDILKAAGLTIPTNWQDLIAAAKQVTVRDQSGQIQTAGVAMGTTNNTDFWPEIIALLFSQQPKASLANPADDKGVEVLKFYTNFVINPSSKVWDSSLDSSGNLFALGKLAFYFAPYERAAEIQKANSNLHFKVVPVPQLPGTGISYGSFWAEAVSARSKHPKEAWDFIEFLTSQQGEQLMNKQLTDNNQGQFPFSRVDMASQQLNDPYLGTFVSQAPFYKSWYLNSNATDSGLGDELVAEYAEAINAVLQGQDTTSALQAVAPKIQETLKKYGIPSGQ